MKYLSPDIEKLAKSTSNKSLAKPGVSCGIFQDCHDTDLSYTQKMIEFNKKKNG
ncbi:hypothetical protein [Flavicella sp.]|uniref:hypothetical protein n=1 Tax=Flavicella sp. TaxID=2957742 RepID=UPI00263271AC|nr:hypothetical protein [Flavicella sp.]MDG1805340.1 hypothetical protein [Flavicella sp.]